MELFKLNTQIDFLRARKWTGAVSLLLVILSFVSLATRGIHWGLDFTGGTVMELEYPQAIETNDVRTILDSNGFQDAVIQHFGSTHNILIRLAPREGISEQAVGESVRSILQAQDPSVKLLRSEVMGAQLGKELAEQGGLAILVALIGTMLYIAFRFEWRFAVGAGVALAHDPILILGLFSFFQFEFDLPTLAGILAVIGYSLNDTIVVFDRVKENFLKLRKGDAIEIVNLSLNQTLSRTLMTSFLTLLVVTSLLVYGGPTLFGFSFALFIGIIVGTYSSIYVAGALSVALGLSRADLMPTPKKQERDEMP
jgi:preprotein translocase subunit SecF